MSAATSRPCAVVDANVWIARYLPDDRFHQPSRDWLDAWLLDDGEVVAPILLLGEVGGAIARRTGDSSLGRTAIAELERIPVVRLVDLDTMLGKDAARLAAELHLRGADAVYVALAAQRNLPLITWDQEMLSRASNLIGIRTPPNP